MGISSISPCIWFMSKGMAQSGTGNYEDPQNQVCYYTLKITWRKLQHVWNYLDMYKTWIIIIFQILAFSLQAHWTKDRATSMTSGPYWAQALGDYCPILALLAWAVALAIPGLWSCKLSSVRGLLRICYCSLRLLWAQGAFQSLGELLGLGHVRRMFHYY